MGRSPPAALDQYDPGSSVLVVSPSMDASDIVTTVEGIRSPDPTDKADDERPTVVVSRVHTAEAILDAWRSRIGDFPSQFSIVSIGEVTRSITAGTSSVELPQAHILTVGTEDVTGIGIAIGDALSRWDEGKGETEDSNTDSSPNQHPILWFESLTPLLERKGLEMTFRFLHVTLEEIRRADAVAYVHVDSSVHDRETIMTLTHLFDDVVEFEP
ncbi:DUF7504 family protein [Natronosalvus rutilus]|uniref:Uncharacterized protein n=1 Tax=Natronosalvus rutilus TaxID=2953753 RepID=A0A9E7NE24_9EURY|nr:hypothetical protein [Natronosalvus rutilus]UTF55280.1 hypothetical protein NGM29_08540 [Natronosalvus rutilus]